MTRPLPRRVLVTGATGFVGRHMCDELVRHGVQVRSLIRSRGGQAPPGTESSVASGLDDAPGLGRALDGIEGVIHLAAHVHQQSAGVAVDPRFRVVNVDGTRRLLEIAAAAGVRDFVFASSVKAVGEVNTAPWTEEVAARPEDEYGVSKLEAERVVRELAGRRGIHAPILRFPLVYGPYMKANILRLFRAVDRGTWLPLASIRNRRSFLFVGNLTAAVIATLQSENGSETFFVNDGRDLSVSELVTEIARALGKVPRLIPVPLSLLHAAAAVGDGPARLLGRTLPSAAMSRLTGSLATDTSKLERQTGFRAPYSVEEGLKATAEWYRSSVRTA